MNLSENTLLWLLPVFILTLLAFYALLCFKLKEHWQKNVQNTYKELRKNQRELQVQRRQIQSTLQTYSPDDPAPYGPRAALLSANLEQIQHNLEELEHSQVAFQERARQLEKRGDVWHILTGLPLQWRKLQQETRQLQARQAELQVSTHSALDVAGKLESASLEVAQKAQQVSQLASQVNQEMTRLKEANLQGAAIDQALELEADLQAQMQEIPAHFVDGSQLEILENSTKESVSQVQALVEQIKPQLEKLLSQINDWRRQQAIAVKSVGELEQEFQQTTQLLEQAPASLELGEQKGRLTQIETVLRNLNQTLGRLEIESIPLVIQEARRLLNILHGIQTQVHAAQEKSPQLTNLLARLSNSLKEISSLVASLGTQVTFPIQWKRSSALLSDLNRQVTALGGMDRKRLPEEVSQDLEKATQIDAQLGSLVEHCKQVGEQHNQLLQTLAGPEFKELETWLNGARQLITQSNSYASENWPRLDDLPNLAPDLDWLQKETQRLIPSEPNTRIPEDELATHLAEVTRLAQGYQDTRSRVGRIQDRLKQIRTDEKNAQEQLAKLQATLAQIAYLVRSNPYLKKIAEGELDQLSRQLDSQQEALLERQNDVLERKIKAIQATAIRLEQSSQQWLDELSHHIRHNLATLANNLSGMDAIAPLSEGAVDEARRVLSTGQVYQGEQARKSFLDFDELLPELKRRSDFSQTCSAAAQALKDQAEPLLEAYQAASTARKIAHDNMADVANQQRQANSWPPTSLSLETERSELSQLEARWTALQNSPGRAIQLVGQLGQLSGAYQALNEKVRQTRERAAQEQAQVEELESDLLELGQRWQEQWQAYQDEPGVSAEIRSLLNDLERELSSIRRQAQQKGSTFEQTLQALKTLHRKLRYYQVALDEEHALDASGNVQRRR